MKAGLLVLSVALLWCRDVQLGALEPGTDGQQMSQDSQQVVLDDVAGGMLRLLEDNSVHDETTHQERAAWRLSGRSAS